MGGISVLQIRKSKLWEISNLHKAVWLVNMNARIHTQNFLIPNNKQFPGRILIYFPQI